MLGQIAYDWKIIDMPRFSGGSERPGAEIVRPSSSMVPSLGSRKPAIMRSVVVLPQPDGPSSETNSPRVSASVARSTAVKAPKRQVTSRRTSLLTPPRSEEHTSELQSHLNLVCRLLLEKKKKNLYHLLILIIKKKT